ncbi:MAG: hypothetical protein ACM3U2_12500 [Deltaproteobacteria bacterium]
MRHLLPTQQQFLFLYRLVMIPQAALKTGRGVWGATLVLLASALLSPSSADASCGDYVMIGRRHVGGHAAQAIGGHETPTPASPGCHGPMCSNNSIPPAAPAPKIEVAVERWAVPGSPALDVLPIRDVLPADVHVSPCAGFGLGILRPPR